MPVNKEKKRQHGFGIAIRTPTDIVIDNNVEPVRKLYAADIVIHNCRIRVISAYKPNKREFSWKKEKFDTDWYFNNSQAF